MIINRIGFAAWVFMLGCPMLSASTNFSCSAVETAPRIGDDILQTGQRCMATTSNANADGSTAPPVAANPPAAATTLATIVASEVDDTSGDTKTNVAVTASRPVSAQYIRNGAAASAQNVACCSGERAAERFPHPYVIGSLSFNGAGYSPLSEILGAGLRMDLRRVVAEAEVSYDNARKTNDNTGYNPKGRERSAQSRMFYKLDNGFYFGVGAQWNQLSTSHYSKQAWRPTVGVGKDFIRETQSLRLQAMYITAGTDRANGVQGPEIDITYPSPATRGHLFWRTTWSIYRFHTTDTFSDPATSALQRADHHFTGGTQTGLIWRF